MTTKYGFGTTLPVDFEHAIDVVTEALQQAVRQRLERVLATAAAAR